MPLNNFVFGHVYLSFFLLFEMLTNWSKVPHSQVNCWLSQSPHYHQHHQPLSQQHRFIRTEKSLKYFSFECEKKTVWKACVKRKENKIKSDSFSFCLDIGKHEDTSMKKIFRIILICSVLRLLLYLDTNIFIPTLPSLLLCWFFVIKLPSKRTRASQRL